MIADDRRRAIGNVVQVAADRLVVELHGQSDTFTVVGFDDIHYVARIGAFVMIPTGPDYAVCEVVGLRERDASTNATRSAEEVLDKTSSVKFLDVVPVGTLPQQREGGFRFGVSTFPSLYSEVLYCRDHELDRIFDVALREEPAVGSSKSDHSAAIDHSIPTRLRTLTIGTSVVFEGFAVKAKIDELFGGHVAVLGNTGSGKSCTVATLVQSLFEKTTEHPARGATFLLVDVNGEYRQALSKLPSAIGIRSYVLGADGDSIGCSSEIRSFRIPHWFMSVEEWELLLRASERTQQPVLRAALGLTSLFGAGAEGDLLKIQNHVLALCFHGILTSEAGSPTKKDRITGILSAFNTPDLNLGTISPLIAISYGEMVGADALVDLLQAHIRDDIDLPGYRHIPFEFRRLEDALELALLYEEAHGNRQIRDYCAQLLTRFKWINERDEFRFLRSPLDDLRDYERDPGTFVEQLLGLERRDSDLCKVAQVSVIDLNEADDEVVEVAAAVVARLVFERLRRADPRNRLPVNFVLEEAHRYIAERPSRYAIDAGRTFERIAKEGRKYGLFLIVASQRPSELSKTVLSQCANFVVHRIQNPDDLAHIRQMTPFISENVLKRLPSLPKQHALVFGNSVNIPTTFRVRDVDPKPKSDDARISELWFRPEGEPSELK
ncbi:MAG: DUF87 domain-containing protein [bacterium]|nr:DUF87 domain-containing protein [bacterium]